MGSMVDAVTSATISLESVNVVITQPAATTWIRPPRLESKVADHSARNIGCLKGANGPEATVVFVLAWVELVSLGICSLELRLRFQLLIVWLNR